MVGSEAEFDKRARVGHGLVLPAIVGLEMPQRVLSRGIPLPSRHAGHVMLANQSFLDLMRALGIDLLLAANFLGALALVRTGAARRSSARSGSRMH